MTCYFFDTENPGGHGFIRLLRRSDPRDEFYLFCTEHTPLMLWTGAEPGDVESICRRGGRIHVQDCDPGQPGMSGLDFQISVELGLVAARHPKDQFVIVSGDQGFDVCVSYLTGKGFSVSRVDSRELPADAAGDPDFGPWEPTEKEQSEIGRIREELVSAGLSPEHAEYIFRAYNLKDPSIPVQEVLFRLIGTHETTEFMRKIPRNVRKSFRII